MITLYTFGPKFGLPDPSPFCLKALVLLKMSGLDFELATASLQKAPKGKAPYMSDGDLIVPDSTFIRLHLETTNQIDFDKGLNAQERAVAWAFEKLCEDHLYWPLLHERWAKDANFNAGPIEFFQGVPAVLRPLVVSMVRRTVRRDLRGQGMGRHSGGEIVQLATRAIDHIAAFIGDKDYLMGKNPCGADASVFATLAEMTSEQFDTPLIAAVSKHKNLIAYRDRMMKRYFPDFEAAR